MTGKPWPMDGSSDVLGGNNDLGAGLHTRSQWKKADHRGTLDRSVGEAAVAEWAGGAFLAASTWGPFRAGSPFPGEKAVVLEVPEEAQHAGSNRSRNRFRAYTGAHF